MFVYLFIFLLVVTAVGSAVANPNGDYTTTYSIVGAFIVALLIIAALHKL